MVNVETIYGDLRVLLQKDATLLERMMNALQRDRTETIQACRELARFLVLKSLTPDRLVPPLHEVDLLWHEFILHTEPYCDFCQEHFGTYIHHRPTK